MPFSTRMTIAFGDTDPAGMVYYPNLFHYCHVTMERFFAERCAIAYSDLLKLHRLGFPTVKIEAEFISPLLYGDEVEIRLTITSIGRSSASFEYTLYRVSDMVVCARAAVTQVAMNLDHRRAIMIPDELRTAFQKNSS